MRPTHQEFILLDLGSLARALDQEQRPISANSVREAIAIIRKGVPKAPQDMNLRELFDHVAIVNDAIRAALLTHPGMTSPEWEFKTVETGRKSGTGHKDVWPEGDGWEIDLTRGRPGEGWDRFDCHEELYFRRRRR